MNPSQSPIPSSPPWHITLSSSDLITIFSIVITAISIAIAIFQWLQAKSAKELVKAARKSLVDQLISQRFSELATKATDLLRHIRAENWKDSLESALFLNAGLANAIGIPTKLISDDHRKQVNVAVTVMSEVMKVLPRDGTGLNSEIVIKLMESCQVVLISVLAVSEGLRLTAALEGSDHD